MNDLLTRQRGDRGDRAVAIGAFLAFLVTGFFGEEPPPRDVGTQAAAARHAVPATPDRR